MKKVLFMLAAAFLSTAASAQIVMSRSVYKQKRPHNTHLYIKAGAGVEGVSALDPLYGDTDYYPSGRVHGDVKSISHFAYGISLGIDRTIGQQGAYWAVELGAGSHGATFEIENAYINKNGNEYLMADAKFDEPARTAFLLHLMPQLGWKFKVNDNIKIDTHIGGYFGLTLPNSDKYLQINYIDTSVGFPATCSINNYGYHWGNYGSELYDIGARIGAGVWIDNFNIDLSYRHGFMTMFHGAHGMAWKFLVSLGYAIPL